MNEHNEAAINIRPANVDDLLGIARIHKSRFSSQLMGCLPCSLIAKFYACQLPYSILLVHLGEKGVDGFVQGGRPIRMAAGRREFLRSNWLRCLWATMFRPQLWWLALKLFMKRGTRIVHQSQKSLADCCLRCLAVDPSAAGKGIGSALIEAYESVIRADHSSYWLSVHDDNAPALRLYEKMGFHSCNRRNGHIIVLLKKFSEDNPVKTSS